NPPGSGPRQRFTATSAALHGSLPAAISARCVVDERLYEKTECKCTWQKGIDYPDRDPPPTTQTAPGPFDSPHFSVPPTKKPLS
ncbi:Dolichyl-phosphate beta-glucosyltransferase ALG5B, partial [Dissostichus eleginoides]